MNKDWTSISCSKTVKAAFDSANPGLDSNDHLLKCLLAAWNDMSHEIQMIIVKQTKEMEAQSGETN